MQQLKQPNSYSCLPTSFAMLLDIPVEDLIKKIGHDGSRIAFPGYADPLNRIGFHPMEIFNIAWDLGFWVMEFDESPRSGRGNFVEHINVKSKIKDVMKFNHCVVIGKADGHKPHAVAWSWVEQMAYDPNGSKHKLEGFIIDAIYVVGKR